MGKGRHQPGLEPWEVETIYSLVTWRPSQQSVCIPREVGGGGPAQLGTAPLS